MIDRTNEVVAPGGGGGAPNPGRWMLFKRELESGTLDDYRYTAVRDHGLPLVRAVVDGIFASQKLDAIVYPTASRRPALIAESGAAGASTPDAVLRAMGMSATNLANLTGYPDLIVPAGFTGDRLPVGISFLGPAFSEATLLALGYSFEQATHARRRPAHAPPRAGEMISIP